MTNRARSGLVFGVALAGLAPLRVGPGRAGAAATSPDGLPGQCPVVGRAVQVGR